MELTNKENKVVSLTEKDVITLWNHFNERMGGMGYDLLIHNGDWHITDGTVADKDDFYVPIIRFLIFQSNPFRPKHYVFSIEIQDRNGNKILDGKSIGYIRFSEYTKDKLDEAIDFIVDIFGQYNEDNTVPTKFEKIEITF